MRSWVLVVLVVSCSGQAQDHVGQPIPKYVTGDECLFCHRVRIADTWQPNPHARTTHPVEPGVGSAPDFPKDATDVLGAHAPYRALKQDGYGKFDLYSTSAKSWDKDAFAARCAGCHTTAVDPKTRQFSTSALDCYVCHGVVPEQHPNNISLVWFSAKHGRDPKQIVSICGQCHLRGSKSRSSGLPYPDNFVAGDELFHDFQADFAQADNHDLNPGDRHIFRDAREVIQKGGTVTCLNCHNIHDDNSKKHRLALSGPLCLDCHNAEGPKKNVAKYAVHSALCEY